MFYKRNQLYKRKIIGGSLFGNRFIPAMEAFDYNKVYRRDLRGLTGGSLFGRILNSARKLATAATNTLKTSNVKGLLASKAKQLAKAAAKEQLGVSDIEDVKKLALAAATKKANEIGSDLAQKAVSKASKRLSPAMQQKIQEIAVNPKVRKALSVKSEEILRALSNPPTSLPGGDRALMSNLMAGSGVKRIL